MMALNYCISCSCQLAHHYIGHHLLISVFNILLASVQLVGGTDQGSGSGLSSPSSLFLRKDNLMITSNDAEELR